MFTAIEIINIHKPSGQIMTRDMIAVGQRIRVPPHWTILSEVMAIGNAIGVSKKAARLLGKAESYFRRKEHVMTYSAEKINKIFIGHGRSKLWLELKDFLDNRLGLSWEEFNRISSAGHSTTERLSEMLNAANFAFIVMTAEDETADGRIIARLNVVHEAGLFQGRIGFKRAIILLEEGCEEFSNIHGLGQIRFSKGNIKSIFEDIREVLERESVL